MTDINKLIRSLEDYSVGSISGERLLLVWDSAPIDFRGIYYNLYHLISDEDIRKKDGKYSKYQLSQLDVLIQGLKQGASMDVLSDISFL